jgi:hypothetical protein
VMVRLSRDLKCRSNYSLLLFDSLSFGLAPRDDLRDISRFLHLCLWLPAIRRGDFCGIEHHATLLKIL